MIKLELFFGLTIKIKNMKNLLLLILLFTAIFCNAQIWTDYHNKAFDGAWFVKSEAGIRSAALDQYTLDKFTWYARPGIGYRYKNFDFEGGIAIFENIDGYTDQRLWQSITMGLPTNFKSSVKIMAEEIASYKYNVRYRINLFAEKNWIAFSTETLYLRNIENRSWIYGKIVIPLFDIYIGGGVIATDKVRPSIRISLKSTN